MAVTVAGSVKIGTSAPKICSKLSMLMAVPSFSFKIRFDSDAILEDFDPGVTNVEVAVRNTDGSLMAR
jgi:hypothetical protein